jgi:hypothetical protein
VANPFNRVGHKPNTIGVTMILFAEDWAKYPTAFPDLSTRNTSFVRLASVYRSMGIENHAFILALVNKDLVGVDPFDPNLTLEQMGAIALESKINPWYFFREVARVPGKGTSRAVYLEANRGNICLFWCFFNHIMIFLIQIRQTGKSLSTDILMNLLLNLVCENTDINLLTKDDVLRRKNIERIKEIGLELPIYLQMKTRDDANNGEEVTIVARKNNYTTHVPQASEKRAINMGRGLTSAIFHVDEPPFQINIDKSLGVALGSTGAAVDAAKIEGTPYGTIFTTTAGKKDSREGAFIYKLLCDSAVWNERFLDAPNLVELEKQIRVNSRGRVCRINATFNHRQLGKTDAWLKEKIDESLQSGEECDRDFFNVWTSGNMSNPLSVNILEQIAASAVSDYHIDISKPNGYITRWYIPENEIERRMANCKTVLGMDTSEASGGDDISFILVDVETLEVLAAGTYNETNLFTFAEWVCSVLVKYENITAIIERRSTGAMLLDYLLLFLPQYGIDPFKRLFNRVVNEYDEEPTRWKEIRQPMNRRSSDIYVRYKKTFGFATAGAGYASRTELYSTTLQNAAKRAATKIRDKPLIDQITGLITKNGRIDHEQGEHDDLVIGWLLCNWLLTLGKNLSHYGIDTSRVMSGIATKSTETYAETSRRYEQDQIRLTIEGIYNQLATEDDDYICMRLEHDLRVLDSKIILEQGETYSIDNLIKQAKESKRSKRRLNGASYQAGRFNTMHDNDMGAYSDRPLNSSNLRMY